MSAEAIAERTRRPRESTEVGPSPADSLGPIPTNAGLDALSGQLTRRLTFVVLLRVVLITLVLGVTTLLYWLSETDLTTPSALVVFGVVCATYLLTIAYSLGIRSGQRLEQLGNLQLVGDLAIAAVIVHATGGAQSAYTFFFPVAIVGAALIAARRVTISVSLAALVLFLVVAILGWTGTLPALEGQEVRPDELSALGLARALALNGAAIVGVSLLAINLGSQLQQTRSTLATQTSATADLLSLHSDIVRSLTSGLITIDAEQTINSINQTATRILGIEALSALGNPLALLMPELSRKIDQLDDTGRLFRTESRFSTGTSELVLGVSLSPLFDRNHLPIGRVLNFQDLTELRKMEEQVRRAERLAVIGALAAGVAHEIRNPLASISGSIELLQESPPGSEENRALMQIATREIERLNDLISELLDYTNPRAPNKTNLDIVTIARDTVDAFAHDRDFARVDVEVSLPSEVVMVTADPEKLRQVLWNLLRNGAEAAMDGGRHVVISVEAGAGFAAVEVRDDGPGIASDDLERIFDPFFTTKERGTGLGLAMVHSIVREHGGTIRARSTRGKSTTLRLELPYTPTSEEPT